MPVSDTCNPTPVPLADVERELSRQMGLIQNVGHAPIQRVRMSNLIIFTDSDELAVEIGEHIPEIAAVHPARIFFLVGDRTKPTGSIQARVCVRSHNGDSHQQTCSEQVILHAPGAQVDRLPFAVRALLIGDLPTNLWWASPEPPGSGGVLMFELGERAQQIVYDSLGWRDPPLAVSATAAWLESVEQKMAGRWRVASDLNWRRLKYWRRLVAQALDSGYDPQFASSITETVVEHGPHAVVQAWELASWISKKLSWQVATGKVNPGVEISWRFAGPKGDARLRLRRLDHGGPKVARIQFRGTRDGKPAVMNLAPETDLRLAVTIENNPSAPLTLTAPPLTLAEILGRQLSDREADPVFRESMAVAQVLARSVIR